MLHVGEGRWAMRDLRERKGVAIQKSLFVRYALKIYTFPTAIVDIGSAK
jgi:hypothetical protein